MTNSGSSELCRTREHRPRKRHAMAARRFIFAALLFLAATVLATNALLPLSPSAVAQPATFDLQAHRGGRGETTEESLRAFAKSLELGVSTLELDIVLTREGQPLVWHDPTIRPDKCTDTGPAFAADPQYPYVGKLVHELTLAQIRTLDSAGGMPMNSSVRLVADDLGVDRLALCGGQCARAIAEGFEPYSRHRAHRTLKLGGLIQREHAMRTVPSACHAAYMMLPAHMPDAYQATVTSLHDFAASL